MANNSGQLPPFTGISCSPDRLDLFKCGSDGEVYTSFWTKGSRWSSHYASWKPLSGPSFPPNAPICAISRALDRMDLFVVGSDGSVYNLFYNSTGWCTNWRSIGGAFLPGTPLSAVAPNKGRIYLFACDPEGLVRYSTWSYKRNWDLGWPLLGKYRQCQGIVAAVAHDTDQVDLFALGRDRFIYTKSFIGEGVLTKYWKCLKGPNVGLSPDTVVTAVSCDLGQAKIFVRGNDGCVYVASWDHPSRTSNAPIPLWMSLGGSCSPGTCVSAVSRQSSHIDIFITGETGCIYTNWHNRKYGWKNPTRPWQSISLSLQQPSSVLSIARKSEHLDVFTQTKSQDRDEILTSWWPYQDNKWSGFDSKWRSLRSLPSMSRPAVPDPSKPTGDDPKFPDPKNQVMSLFDAPSIDDSQGPHRKTSIVSAEKWIRELQLSTELSLASAEHSSGSKKVKIAIIDSGVDLMHDSFRSNPIKSWKSFLATNALMEDLYGHGTFTAGLIRKLAPNAELFVARVCLNNKLDSNGGYRVAKAIDWAVSQDVDIISISLGFSGTTDLAVRQAVTRANQWRKDGSQILMFAAASNCGANSSSAIAYPARLHEVISVFSASTMGKESTFSPKGTTETYPNISTLGEHVTSAWPNRKPIDPNEKADATNVLSGTSAATPIAAAIAALILEFGNNADAIGIKDTSFEGLATLEGMTAVLKRIGSKSDDCHFLSSQIFGGMPPVKVAALISQELWDAGFRPQAK